MAFPFKFRFALKFLRRKEAMTRTDVVYEDDEDMGSRIERTYQRLG